MQLFLVTEGVKTYHDGLVNLLAQDVQRQCAPRSVDVQHVGATAVPGLVTKGDLDIVALVESQDFRRVVEVLSARYAVGQPENNLAGESAAFALPSWSEFSGVTGGLQVVRRGGPYDIFLKVRDVLRQHERWRKEMNEVKLAAVGASMSEYRQRKATVYHRLLAWLEEDVLGRDWFDFWEHYRPDPGAAVMIKLLTLNGSVQLYPGVYGERANVADGEDGEVCLPDGKRVSSDTPERVLAWSPLR